MISEKKSKVFWDYVMMTIASFAFALSWEGFMIPNGMSAGGLMGFCTVLQYATVDLIPASVSYVAINAFLIILSILVFGLAFGFRTIYCIIITTLMLEFVGRMDCLHADPGHFFYVKDAILVPVIAGLLEALGVGMIIRAGGSTGGTDIIALIVNKYWPVSLSKVFLTTDFVIIMSLLLLPGKNFGDMVYGFEMMIAFSLVVDTVIGGQKSSFQLLVFSEKYDRIADRIMTELDRGVTVLHAQGWYTKKEKNVLLILISKSQMHRVSRIIKTIDGKAFMSVSQTNNVYGEGFDEIKAGITKKNKSNEQ